MRLQSGVQLEKQGFVPPNWQAPLSSRVLQHWTLDPCWVQHSLRLVNVAFSHLFCLDRKQNTKLFPGCLWLSGCLICWDFSSALLVNLNFITYSIFTSSYHELSTHHRLLSASSICTFEAFFQTLLGSKTNLGALPGGFFSKPSETPKGISALNIQHYTLPGSTYSKGFFFDF